MTEMFYACTRCAEMTETGFEVTGAPDALPFALMNYVGLSEDETRDQLRSMLNGLGRWPDPTEQIRVPLCADCAKPKDVTVGKLSGTEQTVPLYRFADLEEDH